jgi:uncharacterized protein with GYD domain
MDVRVLSSKLLNRVHCNEQEDQRMAKYLCQASYTPEGMRGLIKDKASGRKAAVQAAIRAAGGKLESFYYAFGKDDVVLIVDLPDNATAAGFLTTVAASGMVRIRTTPLLTIEEVDKGLESKAKYRAPGAAN